MRAGSLIHADNHQNSGISKPTIDKYLQYLEAAFLIVRLRRIDAGAKRLTRERNFKVYLVNPSMRAALFGPVNSPDDDAMGALAETAIVTQYLHSPILRELAFALWAKGEIDLVRMNLTTQKPIWAVEVKWSDREPRQSSSWQCAMEFAQAHKLGSIWMTSRTVSQTAAVRGVKRHVMPVAALCYAVGKLAATEGNVLSKYGLPTTFAGGDIENLPEEEEDMAHVH